MTHYLPGNDDDQSDLDAMNFFAGGDDPGEEEADDVLHTYVPAEVDDTATEIDAMRAPIEATAEVEDEDQPDDLELFTVSNPGLTVSVSALVDGSIQKFDLSPKLTGVSEFDLANEILALADLARQKGLAGLHTMLLENQSEMGFEGTGTLPEFVKSTGMDLPSPQEATEARAEVFATRYGTGR